MAYVIETKLNKMISKKILWDSLLILTICIWIRIGIYLRPTNKNECLIFNNVYMQEIARPAFNCSVCKTIEEFPIEKNISRKKFIAKYAYSRIPVLIKSAVNDWEAINVFSYKWFQNLYDSFNNVYEIQDYDGQFFPYKTEFETLEDALHMDEERYKKQWYFGWNNVHSDIGEILREHYQRPEFLPTDSESSVVDWMFMGTPGGGAHVHLDYVNRPSWQAQITGKKTWFLVPVPECSNICHSINVTLHPGDIIIVDTNQWYHSTKTLPGENSITIGSEYD